jgi:ribosomal protein S18 acetylase RimI-like enzyme
MKIRIVEIESITDDLLLPWLDLYEIAFPPHEKVPVSSHLQALKKRARGEACHSHLLAALDENDNFIGLARYGNIIDCKCAYLWYLAVIPEIRNQGIGAAIYEDLIKRAQADDLKAMLFEVEMPSEAVTPEEVEIAERRIGFYKRMGAKILTGIQYLQTVGPHQPATPMHILVHTFKKVDPEEAFAMGKNIYEDSLTRVGSVELE